MRTYQVLGTLTMSVFTEVKASSEAKAIEIAERRPPITLCWSCSGSDHKAKRWVTSGELDGVPEVVEVTEAE